MFWSSRGIWTTLSETQVVCSCVEPELNGGAGLDSVDSSLWDVFRTNFGADRIKGKKCNVNDYKTVHGLEMGVGVCSGEFRAY